MSITTRKYGKSDGREVYAYTLDNNKGLTAEILNYGGIVTKLIYNGVDVVQGFDTLEDYFDNYCCFGAAIGRNSNRIENAEFELNGTVYKLQANDGRNNLHGGKLFNATVWEAEVIDAEEPALVLSYLSPDGEEGFPGNARIKVTYKLTADNAIEIHYQGECDKDTILNMTNHSYFNLNGHASGSIEGHRLWLASEFHTPNTSEVMPDGQILASKGTPFDFSEEKLIGDNLAIENEQIKMFGGFDNNFVLSGSGYRLVGRATGDKSGIEMEIYTDLPGVQLYIPVNPETDRSYKDGASYGKYGAICFETQAFPNATAYSHFPSIIVKKGEKYDTTTAYKFR